MSPTALTIVAGGDGDDSSSRRARADDANNTIIVRGKKSASPAAAVPSPKAGGSSSHDHDESGAAVPPPRGIGGVGRRHHHQQPRAQQQPRAHQPTAHHERYAELLISPGKLGITLDILAERRRGNNNYVVRYYAVIRKVDPACAFKDKIDVGDRIVSIDGRMLTADAADLHVGKDGMRVFGFIKTATKKVLPPPPASSGASEEGEEEAAAAAATTAAKTLYDLLPNARGGGVATNNNSNDNDDDGATISVGREKPALSFGGIAKNDNNNGAILPVVTHPAMGAASSPPETFEAPPPAPPPTQVVEAATTPAAVMPPSYAQHMKITTRGGTTSTPKNNDDDDRAAAGFVPSSNNEKDKTPWECPEDGNASDESSSAGKRKRRTDDSATDSLKQSKINRFVAVRCAPRQQQPLGTGGKPENNDGGGSGFDAHGNIAAARLSAAERKKKLEREEFDAWRKEKRERADGVRKQAAQSAADAAARERDELRKQRRAAQDAADAAARERADFRAWAADRRDEFRAWLASWKEYEKEIAAFYGAQHADGWQRRFRELIRFKDENDGDCNKMPPDYRDPDDLALGEWAELQRELYREGKLDAGRANSLVEQEFDFEYTPQKDCFTGDEQWDDKFKELIEYRKKHSNCDVPINYPVGETLGQWAKSQRDAYNEGTLDEDRHIILEEKGFVFEPGTHVDRTVIGEAWKRNYQALTQFKRDHGHLEVPYKYRATSLDCYLGNWIRKQRAAFKYNSLSRNRIALLEELGIDITARKKHKKASGKLMEEKWDGSFKNLVSYIERNGHCSVAMRDGQLGAWAKRQRSMFRKGKLAKNRLQRLLDIGFDFGPFNTAQEGGITGEAVTSPLPSESNKEAIFSTPAWINNYQFLQLFVENNGHADVPPGYEETNIEGCLHTWIETQKMFFEEDSLPQENVEALEKLGVDLSKKSKHTANRYHVGWNNNFQALKRFHEENGHTDVPDKHTVDGIGGVNCLSRWGKKQLEKFRKNKLSEERIALLRSIGVVLTKKRILKPTKYGSPLGEMPEDDLYFEHEDGIRRRVPSTWEFPRLNFEEIYVMYHCQHHMAHKDSKLHHGQHHLIDKNTKLSPMKMFEVRSDMVSKSRYKNQFYELKLICSIVDHECRRKGVIIKGVMTEEDARKCVQIGSPGLNIPGNVLRMNLRTVFQRKCPDEIDPSKTGTM